MATELRRGFKTWCENAAKGYRRELELRPTDAIDPLRLAQHLGIIVWRPGDVPNLSARDLRQLTGAGSEEWSAATIRDGGSSLVILNDSHSRGRQNNSLTHEIGHIVLHHRPSKMYVTDDGLMMMSDYDAEYEAEATYFAGAILVPRVALLQLLRDRAGDVAIAEYFDVSPELVGMRRKITGVDFQISRGRGAWIP